ALRRGRLPRAAPAPPRRRRARWPFRSSLVLPDIELVGGGVLRRAPRLGVVRRDVVVQAAADLLEQRVVAHLVDRLLEVLTHRDVVDVDGLEHEEAAVADAGELRQLGAVRLGEDLGHLLLRAGLDLRDDDAALHRTLPHPPLLLWRCKHRKFAAEIPDVRETTSTRAQAGLEWRPMIVLRFVNVYSG